MYFNIEKYHYKHKEGNVIALLGEIIMSNFGARKLELNSNYPEKDFEEFICRMIERKKKKIESVLDIK